MFQELKSPRIYQGVIKNLEPEQVITYEDYCALLTAMIHKEHTWPLARRIEICKSFSQKRRIVFNYPKAEMFILRAVNHYLFKKYSDYLSISYYPFQGRNPAQCLGTVLKKFETYGMGKGLMLSDFYGMHFDISDYFNSMDT